MIYLSSLFESLINQEMKTTMKNTASDQAKSFENRKVYGSISFNAKPKRIRNKIVVSGSFPISGSKETSNVRAIYDIKNKTYQYDMDGLNKK